MKRLLVFTLTIFLFGNIVSQNQGVSKPQSFNIQQKDISKIIPAAERGDVVAQLNLAECYYLGKGVEKDEELALQWYKKALLNKEKLNKEEVAKIETIIKKIETDVANKFSIFAKYYVQDKINEWQKKGEFEKIADWQNRVNETSRSEKAKEFYKNAERDYIKEKSKNIIHEMEIFGEYDPENEVFLIKSEQFGNLLISVPIKEAQSFKTNWKQSQINPTYFIENDKLGLKEITFSMNDKSYTYSNKASLNYAVAKIDYNFAPIDFENPDNITNSKGNQNISTVKVTAGRSDVGINIPKSNTVNEKTFAVIIANESYRREADVFYAKNDGEVFKEYCLQTLGLPKKNVKLTTDATLNDFRAAIDWISGVAESFEGEISIIFYYAGHGIPDESSKNAYLLPVDGYGSNVATGYKLDDLYKTLGNLPAKSVVVFLDACFSGAQRSGEMLASTRGVAIRAFQGMPTGNMVVFSAAKGDQTAQHYREKGHGLFTYFLLKKLQETQGEVTLGELGAFIKKEVEQESSVIGKKQTPTVIPSANLENWQNLKLK